MDLNKNSFMFSRGSGNCEFSKHNTTAVAGDTTLCLNGPGFGTGNSLSRFGCKGSNAVAGLFAPHDDGVGLVLGLGPTPSAYSNEYTRSFSMKRSSAEADSTLQLGLSGGGGTTVEGSSISMSSEAETNNNNNSSRVSSVPVVDEGSTSAKRSGGYMPSLLLAPRGPESSTISFRSDYSKDYSEEQETVGTTMSSEQQRSGGGGMAPKKCRFLGCRKGARGASGLCIGHGGGQRCQKPGCNKGAESRTAYCKAHGGGKRCQYLGCTKSAEGKTENCIAHGGGRRCGHPDGCAKAARGRSGLCIRHGGGKRCRTEGCCRSAEGQAGLCISHGGGRRCRSEGCTKGAQGSTAFCKAHGGGRRCVFQGCTKGAEGSTPLCKGHGGGKRCLFDGGGICPKSVHGGTSFCVAHGGGKRCSVPGCTKSARGRTDCCVRHGGGKRCRRDGCGKSAQGSTDFCKAHGGGKRCCWPSGVGCEKFARGKSGLCAAHATAAAAANGRRGEGSSGGGMIGPRLFHGLVPAAVSGTGSGVSDCSRQLIPPQVLVPLSMKSTSSGFGGGSSGFDIPEGRVHGGPLMSLFGGSLNLKNVIDGV